VQINHRKTAYRAARRALCSHASVIGSPNFSMMMCDTASVWENRIPLWRELKVGRSLHLRYVPHASAEYAGLKLWWGQSSPHSEHSMTPTELSQTKDTISYRRLLCFCTLPRFECLCLRKLRMLASLSSLSMVHWLTTQQLQTAKVQLPNPRR
jgi:hypothetical protein